ncbi:MAG: PAS domain S-box protein [Acidobacteriota bacterium]|nr:PAS domain S-box protein [Acidobacteriota bacterium]
MRAFPLWLKISMMLILGALLAGGAGLYFVLRQRILQEVSANLEAIAQLKVNQISDWRTAKQNEAAVITDSPYYIQIVTGWGKQPDVEKREILLRFEIHQNRYQTKDALLVSTNGEVLLSLSQKADRLHEASLKALEIAFRTQKPVVSDFYVAESESKPQLDVVAPSFIRRGNEVIPKNAFLYRYDPEHYLYPVIKNWPLPSRSAETILVRRDGDAVIDLMSLRHDGEKAFSLSFPLSRTDLPAVMAARGKRGIVKGRDYRGIKVLAAMKSVPDTPWLLVAKMDEEEALSALRRESALIAGLVLFLIMSVTAATGILWQRNDKAHYRALFEAENAQRKIEERYRTALDGIAEGCQIIGFDWRYLYINAAAIRYSGLRENELRGRTLMEIFRGIESTEEFAAYQRCMMTRTAQTLESATETPDGKRWFVFSIQPIPEGIFVLSTDITARKHMEDSLRDSEARYRSLFEHMTQGVFRLRANGELIDVNPAALRMLGLTREEFITRLSGDPGLDPVHEDGSPISNQERPPFVAMRTGKPASKVMGLLHPKTKERIWVASEAIPEFEEGKSSVSQVLVTFYDITARKKAEAEQALLASAIEQSGECIILIDTNRIVRYANPVFETVTGKKREEAIGKPLPHDNSDTHDKAFFKDFWYTISSGKVWRGRIVNRKKDGTPYTEEVTASPVFNSAGEIVNYVSVSRDITNVLKLEQDKEKLQEQFLQVQKMESVGRLAGGVAHDFNNMLSVILGHTQLSLDAVNASHPLYMHLQEINQAALRSAELTRQLLAFARKQTIAPKVLDLNDTISGLLSMLRRLLGEDIDLAWMPGAHLWPIRIDPAQVNQVLTNLAVNARDSIDKTGRITIETENMTLDADYCAGHQGFIPGDFVVVSVSDNGCGMEKETLGHLFEPFFTTKKVGEGTGLGLATVYGIVKQNAGFINVYSEPGKGSTFRIYLPRYEQDLKPGKETIRSDTPQGGAETIMLVEDEAAVQKLAKIMLERMGYTVIAAATPTEALRLAQEYSGEIHLLLVDVVMPEMTGRDLSERLVGVRPNLKRLFMSGYTANVIAHHGVLDEGVHFVQKPFSFKTLAAKVREALDT